MKIDKGNPRHWVYAISSLIVMTFGVLIRPLFRRSRPCLVLLYGHKLNGNLLSLYSALVESDEFEVRYVTLDPSYRRTLALQSKRVLLALAPRSALAFARASVVITDHGPQLMRFFPRISNLRFVDVWHGIPFKGWKRSEFADLRAYDETWVPSELLRDIYVNKFGFDATRVRVTGYGRTDRLVREDNNEDGASLRAEFETRRVVLFAPTWSHGSGRTIVPFGEEIDAFLTRLSAVVERHEASLVVRAHLNTKLDARKSTDAVRFLSSDDYPDTEGLLLVSDILVCDWSSIAFDFLLLDRPTIFLDVPAPFADGFTLDPSFRFGEIVETMDELISKLDDFLSDPSSYSLRNGARAAEVKNEVYGAMADGKATDRYLEALRELTL